MSKSGQLDIFSDHDIGHRLASKGNWPDPARFPVNLPAQTVREQVLRDLKASKQPLIVTGFASLDRIIDLLDDDSGMHMRLLLGNEPFESRKTSFVLSSQSFPDEVRDYWLERGISLYLSAKLILAIESIKAGRVEVRFIDDASRRLHAKIYLGDSAVTVGSSNFTQAGLSTQLEANVRFSLGGDRKRYNETAAIAQSYWDVGQDFTALLLSLLEQLLRVVTWQEALARACSELLEGAWAKRYLEGQLSLGDTRLWPSQQAGIAQALWVLENIGSVLVADATGSGKTRMGAHLLRALRDRIWSTGRSRNDLSVLICPPGAVFETWGREALNCGLMLERRSHGQLSHSNSGGYEDTVKAVRRAQTLTVDEAHNYLNLGSQRTQGVLSNMADNVVLFTATPINRGAADLLSLIAMLGADNMEDEALNVLEGLARRKGSVENMVPKDVNALRYEIQRFTVRRTKSTLNQLVDREPHAYLDAEGRPVRYPGHKSMTYDPGESDHDKELARGIRETAKGSLGIALLEQTIEMPEAYREEWSDVTFLQGRLSATKHLALHNIMATLRSSRAALVEHLAGTVEAMQAFGISERIKQNDTGDALGKLRKRSSGTKPECLLSCALPSWLAEDSLFQQACMEEIQRYEAMYRLAMQMSEGREKTKAQNLCGLIGRHKLVLAFDSHLISLEVIKNELLRAKVDADVVVATGADPAARKKVGKLLERTSTARCIALCSDSMSEGVNLQGASAIVHLDMPSVVRIAEQRVGRVDRMDSRHNEIEAWWPNDSAEFSIRSDERFVQRYRTVETLLGSNLVLPASFTIQVQQVVGVEELIKEAEEASSKTPWDGIEDAFSPVHSLVTGPDAIVPEPIYKEYLGVETRVLSRIGLVSSDTPWAFFAISGLKHGAPKWIFIEHAPSPVPVVRLNEVCRLLREKLGGEVKNLQMDAKAEEWLKRFLATLAESERSLLPRRKQRALEQMEAVVEQYLKDARKAVEHKLAARWEAILRACRPNRDSVRPDLDAVAEQWLQLIRPIWVARLNNRRKRGRPLLLKDIKRDLLAAPLPIEDVEDAFISIPTSPPLDERIAACVVGVPLRASRQT